MRQGRKRTREHGQVMVEYVIMLVFLAVFALALLALGGAFSNQSERLVELVSAEVP